jgi:hypothetical protein
MMASWEGRWAYRGAGRGYAVDEVVFGVIEKGG